MESELVEFGQKILWGLLGIVVLYYFFEKAFQLFVIYLVNRR